MAHVSNVQIDDFLQTLRAYYDDFGRHDMLWRMPVADGTFDPYRILVSELMLQQTQVSRVTPKYEAFISRFPDVGSLAAASLADVLVLWSGLGYNRRAKYLYEAARVVTHDFAGVFPTDIIGLQRLPGVGPNTAGAIAAYAYNQPVVYLETNIRTVLIHHFLPDETAIPDAALREILAQITKTVAASGDFTPREFYWAMMDYGAHLKKTVGNTSRASKSFVKQSAFHGSRRQIRGQVIRLLGEASHTIDELTLRINDDRLESVLADLLKEGLVAFDGQRYSL